MADDDLYLLRIREPLTESGKWLKVPIEGNDEYIRPEAGTEVRAVDRVHKTVHRGVRRQRAERAVRRGVDDERGRAAVPLGRDW